MEKITGLQKDVLEIILESQLCIEKAAQERLVSQQINGENGYRENRAFLISMQDAKCEEIKRQLSLLNVKHECVNKVNGVCPLHNVHCAYPECEKIEYKSPLMCVNCKEIYNNPIKQCSCGCKTFTETHITNRK